MTRQEYLNTLVLGGLGLALLGKSTLNLSPKKETSGTHVGITPPSDTSLIWIDTSMGGVQKYFDGKEWTATKAVWG